jgi:hypothetical protein
MKKRSNPGARKKANKGSDSSSDEPFLDHIPAHKPPKRWPPLANTPVVSVPVLTALAGEIRVADALDKAYATQKALALKKREADKDAIPPDVYRWVRFPHCRLGFVPQPPPAQPANCLFPSALLDGEAEQHQRKKLFEMGVQLPEDLDEEDEELANLNSR